MVQRADPLYFHHYEDQAWRWLRQISQQAPRGTTTAPKAGGPRDGPSGEG